MLGTAFVVLSVSLAVPLEPKDPCAWRDVPAGHSRAIIDRPPAKLAYRTAYYSRWAECLQHSLGRERPQPKLRVTYQRAGQKPVVREQTLETHGYLWPNAVRVETEEFARCPEPENLRLAGDELRGPVGLERWYNRVQVTVEVVADGALSPLADKKSVVVFCPACGEGRGPSLSFVRQYQGPHDGKTRLYFAVDQGRLACAEGGGALHLRFYWSEGEHDEFWMLAPFKEIRDVHKRLKPNGKTEVVYDDYLDDAEVCRGEQKLVVEAVGVGSMAPLAGTSSYGPSSHARRETVSSCKR